MNKGTFEKANNLCLQIKNLENAIRCLSCSESVIEIRASYGDRGTISLYNNRCSHRKNDNDAFDFTPIKTYLETLLAKKKKEFESL